MTEFKVALIHRSGADGGTEGLRLERPKLRLFASQRSRARDFLFVCLNMTRTWIHDSYFSVSVELNHRLTEQHLQHDVEVSVCNYFCAFLNYYYFIVNARVKYLIIVIAVLRFVAVDLT